MSHVLRLSEKHSVLVVVDMQDKVLEPILASGPNQELVQAAEFLANCARILEVPIVATEHVPDKMGKTLPVLREAMGPVHVISKTSFGAAEDVAFLDAMSNLPTSALHARNQAVICGIETPICITQTALGLLQKGYQVLVAVDAVSARNEVMQELGLERMRGQGVALSHTESIVYEWMGDSTHPKFREVLQLVKARNA